MSDRDDNPRPRGANADGVRHDDVDPDAPPTAEEIAESRRLRDALEGAREPLPETPELQLVASLRAAWSPAPLDEGVHASMLDDLPTADEIALAAELRDALETSSAASSASDTPDATFARSLRSAFCPASLDEAAHRAIVDKAVGLSEMRKVVSLDAAKAARATTRVRVVMVTTTSILALAASVVVWITTGTAPGQEAPMARVRSTQPLFDEPFRSGETSARIDKIALARASDYRDNRFAKWGVR